ncbi:MAG: hypothetical protein J6Y53_03160 [Alphaproteobacteria bacterium]|nr:hypothetical protein [Alphaproteobacteria bacterium]
MIRDLIIRRKIKKGQWLNDEQELRLFEMPDCVELLPQYIKNWGLIHEEILLELEDEWLFEQYCVTNRHLDQKIVDKIFTDAGAVYYAWQPICAKYIMLTPENEVIMITSMPNSTAEYVEKRRLSAKAELALFSTSGNMNIKRKYIVEKKYPLSKDTLVLLLSSKVPLDRELLYAYMQRRPLPEGDYPQVMVVKRHDLDLFLLFLEKNNHPFCRGAQALLLKWGDKKAINAFIDHHQSFWADAEVSFIKDYDEDILEKYVTMFKLSELAEICLIERNNAKLIKSYLRNHQFCDHAWQYYISLMN